MTYEECEQLVDALVELSEYVATHDDPKLVTVRDQLADFAASLIHMGIERTDA